MSESVIPNELKLLGVMEYQEAKRIRSLLEVRGVILHIVSNPATCSSGGCKPTVEVHFDEADIPVIRDFLSEEKARTSSGVVVDEAQLQQVFDPDAENVVCPACGFQFSPQKSECPDCGLCFSTA